jgi:hypothetical protein
MEFKFLVSWVVLTALITASNLVTQQEKSQRTTFIKALVMAGGVSTVFVAIATIVNML